MYFQKKLEKTVRIGIITNNEIIKEDIYQKFILIIYNPPYKHEKYYVHILNKVRRHLSNEREHPEKIKNQILLGYAEPP